MKFPVRALSVLVMSSLAAGAALAQKGETVKVAWIDPLSGLIIAGKNSPYGRAIYAFKKDSIQPRVGAGGRGGGNVLNAPHAQMYLRFYWNTPILLSPFDPATIYTGAQYFFRSNNRGDTWTMNPNDLTKNVDRYKLPLMGVDGSAPTASKHDGYENNSNITNKVN